MFKDQNRMIRCYIMVTGRVLAFFSRSIVAISMWDECVFWCGGGEMMIVKGMPIIGTLERCAILGSSFGDFSLYPIVRN